MKAPAARRETLVLVAGIVWSLVGLALVAVAAIWLTQGDSSAVLPACGGAVGGYFIYRFAFSHLARKNLARIYAQSPQKSKVCVFAFQNTRSYLLVIIMMTMGYGLRHSGIPKIHLAPFYIAVGVALMLSSLLYYNRLRVAS
ncbi:MAG: hypothetical protein NT028_12065 [candidate division Zixibacteria bacterium]|nr:hypothetical protein [candidate division Zixibacteria bacterium]